MYKTVDVYEFANWFLNSDTYKNNFTHAGLMALFEYIEQYEEDTETKLEFDPIALCCQYAEYESAWDAMSQYQPDDMPVEGEVGDDLVEIQAKNEAKALEWLEERTTVIPFDGGIIIQRF